MKAHLVSLSEPTPWKAKAGCVAMCGRTVMDVLPIESVIAPNEQFTSMSTLDMCSRCWSEFLD